MVADDGRAIFYCRQKTRGEYDFIKTQLEEKFAKIEAGSYQSKKGKA